MIGRIRHAAPGDGPAIRAAHLAAFPNPAEADLVETLAREGDAVASLVAEREGEVAGHILLSRMRATGDGRAYRAVGLGPLAVIPGARGAGFGFALIRSAVDHARTRGEELVFVLGDPAHYEPFGFSTDIAAAFASPYAGPHFMALALQPGLTLPAAGEAAYARAFADLPAA